ncbi:MAG: AbrB family transcriptional regulator [Pseudomonadota bacterium]
MNHVKFADLQTNLVTIAVGGLGAGLGYLTSLPLYALIGPAILVSLLNMAGGHFRISPFVRNTAFLFLGISIGSGLDVNSLDALLEWPIAFLALSIMLVISIFSGRVILTRGFAFDRREAVLATSPGHLSFVVSLGIEIQDDAARILVIQSIRLLALTLCVPFIAILFGVEVGNSLLPPGEAIAIWNAVSLVFLSIVAGYLFEQIRVPAAYLMSGMIVSSIGHVTELTPGILPESVILPGFVILGCLIGSRFSGISFQQLKATIFAGLTVTALTGFLAVAFAIPVAFLLSMPVAHVILAFAPGGLETMIIMGSVLGANPGFLAACHVARLFILSFLVPVMLGRNFHRTNKIP